MLSCKTCKDEGALQWFSSTKVYNGYCVRLIIRCNSGVLEDSW